MRNLHNIIADGTDFTNLVSILNLNSLLSDINRVLDVGSSEGTVLFKELGKEYWVIDVDTKSLATAEEKLKVFSGKHEVIVGDFINYEFDEKFDLILLNNFLTVIPSDKLNLCLTKCHNLLTEGGIIWLRANSNFHSDIKKARIQTDQGVREIQPNKFHIQSSGYVKNYFEKEELIKLVEDNNLNISVIRREDEEFVEHDGNNDIKSEFCIIGMKTS